jgi:hypothetical protein
MMLPTEQPHSNISQMMATTETTKQPCNDLKQTLLNCCAFQYQLNIAASTSAGVKFSFGQTHIWNLLLKSAQKI